MDRRFVGVFDSGIGGLTVLDECRKIMPNENYIYLADTPNAPYGNKSADEILNLSLRCVDRLIERGVKAVVIACNTATNVGAAELRRRHDFPIIGLEPAVKPAFERCKDGRIYILCTRATAVQPKFITLLNRFDPSRATVLPQEKLAFLIENNISNLKNIENDVKTILRGCSDASAIVLGCTHYVFIKETIEACFDRKVPVFDGNEGAARNLKTRLEEKGLATDSTSKGKVEFI